MARHIPSGHALQHGAAARLYRLGAALLTCVSLSLGSGCATIALDRARAQFHRHQFEQAEREIGPIDEHGHNALLEFLERGTIRQSRGDHQGSIDDFLRADAVAERLDYLSLSEGTASLIINDTVRTYRGVPYERMLLHAYAAASYLQLGKVDDAAVEARRMIAMMTKLDGFPDIAYCRYLAGLCLELQGDSEGAALQYRLANPLLPNATIEENTGRFLPASTNQQTALNTPPARNNTPRELVCLIGTGTLSPQFRANAWHLEGPSTVDVFVNGSPAGTSVKLTNLRDVRAATDARLAAMRAVKDATRIGLKYTAAVAASRDDSGLASLIAFLLFALEAPDLRHWETLPLQFHVARVQCPEKVDSVRLVFRGPGSEILGERTIPPPITLNGRTYVTLCREL